MTEPQYQVVADALGLFETREAGAFLPDGISAAGVNGSQAACREWMQSHSEGWVLTDRDQHYRVVPAGTAFDPPWEIDVMGTLGGCRCQIDPAYRAEMLAELGFGGTPDAPPIDPDPTPPHFISDPGGGYYSDGTPRTPHTSVYTPGYSGDGEGGLA